MYLICWCCAYGISLFLFTNACELTILLLSSCTWEFVPLSQQGATDPNSRWRQSLANKSGIMEHLGWKARMWQQETSRITHQRDDRDAEVAQSNRQRDWKTWNGLERRQDSWALVNQKKEPRVLKRNLIEAAEQILQVLWGETQTPHRASQHDVTTSITMISRFMEVCLYVFIFDDHNTWLDTLSTI